MRRSSHMCAFSPLVSVDRLCAMPPPQKKPQRRNRADPAGWLPYMWHEKPEAAVFHLVKPDGSTKHKE